MIPQWACWYKISFLPHSKDLAVRLTKPCKGIKFHFLKWPNVLKLGLVPKVRQDLEVAALATKVALPQTYPKAVVSATRAKNVATGPSLIFCVFIHWLPLAFCMYLQEAIRIFFFLVFQGRSSCFHITDYLDVFSDIGSGLLHAKFKRFGEVLSAWQCKKDCMSKNA